MSLTMPEAMILLICILEERPAVSDTLLLVPE